MSTIHRFPWDNPAEKVAVKTAFSTANSADEFLGPSILARLARGISEAEAENK